MLRLSTAVAQAQAEALALLMRGGELQLLEGATLLAALPLSIVVAQDGEIVAEKLATYAKAQGKPTSFRILSKENRLLLDGSTETFSFDAPRIDLDARVVIERFRYIIPKE